MSEELDYSDAFGAGGNTYVEGESWKTGSALKRERQSIYINWLLTPPQLREPSTKKALAEMLGVDPSTLYKYESEDRFQREFLRKRRGLLKVEDADKIIRAQIEIATDPSQKNSTSAARFLFEWMEKHTDKQDQAVDLSELSIDELMELVNEQLNDSNADRA